MQRKLYEFSVAFINVWFFYWSWRWIWHSITHQPSPIHYSQVGFVETILLLQYFYLWLVGSDVADGEKSNRRIKSVFFCHELHLIWLLFDGWFVESWLTKSLDSLCINSDDWSLHRKWRSVDDRSISCYFEMIQGSLHCMSRWCLLSPFLFCSIPGS